MPELLAVPPSLAEPVTNPADQLRPWQHAPVFVAAFLILASHRPDAILHAQFWAEDGHAWFADAYNLGAWHVLFHPQDGYIQLLARMGAAFAMLAPLALAPLCMNLIAFLVQALPVSLLLSTRSSVFGSLRFRAAMAAVYLALPNCGEVRANLTNTQWVLALCAFLLLTASPPRRAITQLCAFAVVLLCGLTGPFCLMLLPVAIVLVWSRRTRSSAGFACILFACCLVQGLSVMVGRANYAHVLGAGPAMLVRLLGSQVFLGALAGTNTLATHTGLGLLMLFALLTATGITIIAICFAISKLEIRLFLILSALLFAAALASPSTVALHGITGWEAIAGAGGIRYWFFPTLAFAWSLLICARNSSTVLRRASIALLCLMCFGVVRDWHQPAFKDMHFAGYAREFAAAPPGAVVTIPENPAGWTVRLKKR
jgi:hypothetical protein